MIRGTNRQPFTAADIQDVSRSVLRWHGGKWKLAPWIISHFPRLCIGVWTSIQKN